MHNVELRILSTPMIPPCLLIPSESCSKKIIRPVRQKALYKDALEAFNVPQSSVMALKNE